MKPLKTGALTLQDGSFHVCAVLTPGTIEELGADLKTLKGKTCSLIEWRADYLYYSDGISEDIGMGIRMIKEAFPEKPLLFTYRWREEGGQASLDPRKLLRIRRDVVKQNLAEIMDLEMHWFRNAQKEENLDTYFHLMKEAKEQGMKVLLSWHDFSMTPDEESLLGILRTQEKLGADIAKIAVHAVTEADLKRLMHVSRCAGETLEIPHIALSMGDQGAQSRYDRKKSMTCITFAPVHQPSAPGQLSLGELNEKLKKS